MGAEGPSQPVGVSGGRGLRAVGALPRHRHRRADHALHAPRSRRRCRPLSARGRVDRPGLGQASRLGEADRGPVGPDGRGGALPARPGRPISICPARCRRRIPGHGRTVHRLDHGRRRLGRSQPGGRALLFPPPTRPAGAGEADAQLRRVGSRAGAACVDDALREGSSLQRHRAAGVPAGALCSRPESLDRSLRQPGPRRPGLPAPYPRDRRGGRHAP